MACSKAQRTAELQIPQAPASVAAVIGPPDMSGGTSGGARSEAAFGTPGRRAAPGRKRPRCRLTGRPHWQGRWRPCSQNRGMPNPPSSLSQHRNPLHGVTLEAMVSALVAHYGWANLAERIPLRCFSSDPSIGSSLKFLRKTPWARDKVEGLYLFMLRDLRRAGSEGPKPMPPKSP
jgi:hypothetical protein